MAGHNNHQHHSELQEHSELILSIGTVTKCCGPHTFVQVLEFFKIAYYFVYLLSTAVSVWWTSLFCIQLKVMVDVTLVMLVTGFVTNNIGTSQSDSGLHIVDDSRMKELTSIFFIQKTKILGDMLSPGQNLVHHHDLIMSRD